MSLEVNYFLLCFTMFLNLCQILSVRHQYDTRKASQNNIFMTHDNTLQGWHQEFSDGGLTLLTRGLKYGFQGTINAKDLQKNCFSPSNGS